MSNKITRKRKRGNTIPIATFLISDFPLWPQLSFQISTHTLHSFIHPPHIRKICFAPTPPGPVSLLPQFTGALGFTLLPDSLEFTVVSHYFPVPTLPWWQSPTWDSPHLPSLLAARLPSSAREGMNQAGCASSSCFLMSTGPQTHHPLWNNSSFSLFLIFCAQVFSNSGMLGGPTSPLWFEAFCWFSVTFPPDSLL